MLGAHLEAACSAITPNLLISNPAELTTEDTESTKNELLKIP